VETWPSREIGHPFPEILIPFLEDENLLTGLETFHIWIELLACEGIYSTVRSLRVEASHRQLSVLHGIDSALASSGSQASQPESQLQGVLITGVLTLAVSGQMRKEASGPCDFMYTDSYFLPGLCAYPRVNDRLSSLSVSPKGWWIVG